MKRVICLLCLFFSSLHCEETFPIDMDIYVNGEKVGKADFLLSPITEKLTFIPFVITEVVASALNEQGVEHLHSLLKQFSTLGFEENLHDDLLSLQLSSKDQSLHIEADPHLIAKQTRSLKKESIQEYNKKATKKVPVSKHSGYLNVLFGEKFNKTEYPAYTYAKQEETATFDGAINISNWVLQGFGYYAPKGESKINHGNLLLTRDFPKNDIRLSFGDINTLGFGFQNTVPMAGVSVHKNARLFTDSTVGPSSRHEIFLNAASMVEVFIDGIKLSTLQLRAGPHVLENFPIVNGLSNVVLKITSPTGEERTVDLGYFYSVQELKSGESEYYFSIGLPTYDNTFQHYGTFPLYVGSFQFGISDRINLGAYFQGHDKGAFAGTEVSLSNRYFNTLFDFGASFVNASQIKSRIHFSSIKRKTRQLFDWQLSAEYTDRNFYYLGLRSVDNKSKYTLSGSFNFNFWKNGMINVLGEYKESRNMRNSFHLQGIFSAYLTKYLSAKVIGRYEKKDTGKYEKSVAFNIDFVPRIKDLTLRNNYNSKTRTFMSDANYVHRLSENRSIAASVGYQRGEGAEIARGTLKYQGNHCVLNGSHYLALLSTSEKKSTVKTTSANIGTALVFADKTFAISKPIRDSFVIIAPNQYIKEQNLIINPKSKDDYVARATYYRPAVLPLSSYRDSMLHVTSDASMIGQTFENESIEVKSTHKSGSVVKLGDPPTHIIEGYFFDQNQNPLSLIGGLLIDYQNESRPCFSFFTDEKGKFQMIGVPDGEYEIKMLHDQKSYPILKVDGDIYLDVGKITINVEEQS